MKEEEEAKHKGKDIATGSIELQSHVQKLEDELQVSEKKKWNLIEGNTALQIKLKASREEVDRVRQEMTADSAEGTGLENSCLMHLYGHL